MSAGSAVQCFLRVHVQYKASDMSSKELHVNPSAFYSACFLPRHVNLRETQLLATATTSCDTHNVNIVAKEWLPLTQGYDEHTHCRVTLVVKRTIYEIQIYVVQHLWSVSWYILFGSHSVWLKWNADK